MQEFQFSDSESRDTLNSCSSPNKDLIDCEVPSKLKPGTLPRHEIQAFHTTKIDQETIEKSSKAHSQSNCAGSSFRVRCGPDYHEHGRKKPSSDALYEVFAVDIYRSAKKINHFGRFVDFDWLEKKYQEELKSEVCQDCEDEKSENEVEQLTQSLNNSNISLDQLKRSEKLLSSLNRFNSRSSNDNFFDGDDDPSTTKSAPTSFGSGSDKDETNTLEEDEHFDENKPNQKYLKTRRYSSTSSSTLKIDSVNNSNKIEPSNSNSSLKVDDDEKIPPQFVINTMIPDYAPAIVQGWRKDDGEGYNVVLYCRLTEKARKLLDNCQLSPSLKLLKRFILCRPHFSDKSFDQKSPLIRKKFKVIARVMNTDYSDFNTFTRTAVQQWNAKPFLARTSSSFYFGRNYFETDVDVHKFGYSARIGLHGVKQALTSVVFDFAFVLQSENNDEMPEQILACARLSKLSPSDAESFPANMFENVLGVEKEKSRSKSRSKHGKSKSKASPNTFSNQE